MHDVKVGAGMGGLGKKGFVRVALVQPFDKRRLGSLLSLNGLPAAVMQEVHAAVVQYMQPNV